MLWKDFSESDNIAHIKQDSFDMSLFKIIGNPIMTRLLGVLLWPKSSNSQEKNISPHWGVTLVSNNMKIADSIL